VSPRSKSTARTPRSIRLGEQDIELLWFLAEHRMVLHEHVAELFGTSEQAAGARLNRLAKAGYIESVRLYRNQPAMQLIARDGLKVLGSALPAPKIDVHAYEHDVGVAWLWIAARRGTFGPLREVVGERRMRSHDGARDRDTEPFAVKLGGFGPWGRERLHYPDLLLRTADGRRVALELELSSKGRARRERILAGYAADPRFDGVVYLVQNASIARGVQAAARRLGISPLVHIRRVRSTVTSLTSAPAVSAQRAAPARRGSGRSR
jgi:DNA-binding Lrp family transcriptional regulator